MCAQTGIQLYCENPIGDLLQQLMTINKPDANDSIQQEIWCGSVAKFVTLSVIDDLRIISVINRVASKNNLTTKPV